jgi:uncharacterized protein (TIGR02646 family)
MRPVDRGLAPRPYAKYQDAIADLEERLGQYCSYCERKLSVGLAVEHVLPKVFHPNLITEWSNFLLACTNCNSTKSEKIVELKNALWPDQDNTFLTFVYSQGGFVRLADGMNEQQKTKAKTLLDLVGLQRHAAEGWENPAARDKRWQDREECWTAAERCLDNFKIVGQTEQARELVLIVAKSVGFFSIWMTVFADFPEVKKDLIRLLPGTALSCFDAEGKAMDRPDPSL